MNVRRIASILLILELRHFIFPYNNDEAEKAIAKQANA